MNPEGLILTRTGFSAPNRLLHGLHRAARLKKIRRAEGGASHSPKSLTSDLDIAIIGQPVTVNFRPSGPTQASPKPDQGKGQVAQGMTNGSTTLAGIVIPSTDPIFLTVVAGIHIPLGPCLRRRRRARHVKQEAEGSPFDSRQGLLLVPTGALRFGERSCRSCGGPRTITCSSSERCHSRPHRWGVWRFGGRGAAEARIDEIPCILPASREFGIFRDEFAADSPLQRRVRELLVPKRRIRISPILSRAVRRLSPNAPTPSGDEQATNSAV
jgi:hypothetical protein